MTIHLSQFVNYVYPFLDDRSRGRLARVNKELSKCEKMDRFHRKLATFILRNYDVIASSLPSNRLHELFFRATPLIMFGETHSIDAHRFLTSNLINLLWSENAELFIEGASHRVEEWKKSENSQSMLKYLWPEVRLSARTWDSDEHNNHSLLPMLTYTKETVSITQITLDFFSKSFTYRKLIKFIEAFHESFRAEFQQIMEIELFKVQEKKLSPKEKSVLRKRITAQICKAILKIVGAKQAHLFSIVQADCVYRNQSLVQHTTRIFKGCVSAGFFIGGIGHMVDQYVLEQIKELKKRVQQSHFVILNPKEMMTHLSALKDYRDFFPLFEIKAAHSQPTFISHKYNQLSSILNKDEPLTKAEIDYLKAELFDVNPETINPTEHHFGIWEHVCRLLLQQIANQA